MIKVLLILCLLCISLVNSFSLWESNSREAKQKPTFGGAFGSIIGAIPKPSDLTNAIPFLKIGTDRPKQPTSTSYEETKQNRADFSKNVPPAKDKLAPIDQLVTKGVMETKKGHNVVKTVDEPAPEMQDGNAVTPNSVSTIYEQYPEDTSVTYFLDDALEQSTESYIDASTTEDYESTTEDFDVFNRMGAPPAAVVASLLGG